jgi:RNA polymerase primary sigma factor
MVTAFSQDPDGVPPSAGATISFPSADGGVSLVGTYLRQAVQVPLLTAVEEIELAQAREEGLSARRGRAENPAPERDVELEALVRRGEEANRRLIEANLRLVVGMARQRQRRGCASLGFLDLIQEGNLGLIRAVEKYDWRLGYRFSTYAIWWIRRAIDRALAEHGRPIRIPLHLQESVSRLAQAEAELLEQHGRQPKQCELAEASGIAEKRVAELRRYLQPVLSLDQPVGGEEGGLHIVDMLADGSATAEMEDVPQGTLGDEIDRLLVLLAPRERTLISLRFGLDGGTERTLEDVGRTLGVTRERARQIEVKALRKLRSFGRTASLRDYFGA